MNDQQETTANTQEPKLCRMGCGFFGSNATGDCCSRCWNNARKEDESPPTAAAPAPAVAAAPQPAPPAPAVTTAPTPAPATTTTEEPEPMDVEETKPSPAVETKAPIKKKKKKKTSYKNMIAGMMESGERDAEKDKDAIKKVTGGGAFLKVDKI